MLKSGRGLSAFLLVFFAIITFSSFAFANAQLLFDRNLIVSEWYVHASQNSFSAADAQEARIKISKITPDKEIQRGFFVLNGAFTFLRDFLTGDEQVFEKDVTLKDANSLVVFLLGEPGAKISFQVIGQDGPAPAPEIAAFTAEPLTIKRGDSATLSWQTVNADSCSIEPGIGAVDPNGSHSVTPTDPITYTLTAEGTGDPATAVVTVTIENSAPVADPQTVSTDEDTALAITLSATDVDDDSLTYAVTDQPDDGALSGTPPNLTYTPNANYNGADAFSFTANDGQADGNTAVVTLNIAPINDAPAASAGQDREVFVGDPVTLDGSGSTDVDTEVLSYSWTLLTVPEGSAVALSDPSAEKPTFTPDLAGSYEVGLIVNDGAVDSPADTVMITASIRMVVVPDVVGMPQAEAETALMAGNLVVGTITGEYSETVEEGKVISQSPAAGTSVEESSAVNLTISVGSASQPPAASFSASPTSIEPGQSSTLNWNSLRAESAHIDNGVGAVAVEGSTAVSPEQTTTYTLTVSGPTGSANARVTVQVVASPEPQPEGSYGEQYQDLVPPDATVDQYDPERFSVITGLVNDINQQPLSGVRITIHSHAEYGSVLTDDQGRFSIPVEGGGTLTVVYQKQGLISAQRKVNVPWNDNAIAETVVMISEDPVATTLTFDGNADTVVTHKSEDVVDESGKRAVTMVFSGDNKAYLVDEEGNDVQELTTITTRATEYQTPLSMPAKLPPNSAFTYCAELSVDGVQRVRFDKPVTTFIDNFLGFPVGSIVPVGYYDRDKGVWVPSENGVVVQLLDTNTDGVTDALDADGDGAPDDLDADGSSSDEVQGLEDGQRYAPGATFWRVQINHFTPWDCNWPFGPPVDAVASNAEGMPVADQQNLNIFDSAAEQSLADGQCVASYVERRSRVFHEDIPIPGTAMTLHYASSRVAGYKPGVISVPVSGETVPESLVKIIVEAVVAGKKYKIELPPEPNQIAEFEWDGLDYLGRPVRDSVVAHIRIGFVYYGVYFSPSSQGRAFGQAGINSLTVPTRQEVTLWNDRKMSIIIGKGSLAEGWTLSAHHQASPLSQNVLLKGDGTISRNRAAIIETYAGDGSSKVYLDGLGGPATSAKIPLPSSLAMDMEGNLYIFCSHLPGYQNWRSYILKVDTEGIVTMYSSAAGFWGKNGYIAADVQGNFYYSAYYNWYGGANGGCVKKIDPAGEISTVVGACGPDDYSYSGISFKGMHIDNQGNIYAAVSTNKVLKMDPAGVLTVVAGTGTYGFDGDGGPAVAAQLRDPKDVYLDDEGNLYIACVNRVRKVDPSGIIATVAGGGASGTVGNGGPATEAYLYYVEEITMDAAGNLYIAESWNNSIRKVDTHGVITTVAGLNNLDYGYSGDGVFASLAQLNQPKDVLIDRAGNMFIADMYNGRVRKVSPPSAGIEEGTTESAFSFTEKNGLGYIMSSDWRHMQTVDLNTRVSLYDFTYDGANNLVAVADRFGNTIQIERDAATDVASAIISPDGVRTGLTIDENNHLKRVTYADGSFYDFEYTSDGLMLMETEPAGNQFEHIFDDKGRLADVLDGEGGHWAYTRAIDASSEIQTEVLSAEGNLTTFLDHTESTGKYTSTIIDPTGAVTNFVQSDDGLTQNHSLPCGTEMETIYDLDTEYKYKYVKQITESTPAGLERLITIDKAYTDTDQNDSVDLTVETVTVNGKATSIGHNILTAQKTVTSPEGRTLISLYDPTTLQVKSISTTGLHPTGYIYDSKGRLASVTTDTRQSLFTYTTDGFLDSVTDPEGQKTSYEYDPIGRMTGINRPDGNYVDFSYDANGNMTVLINPAGTEHKFGYNQVNRNSSYTTPLSGSYSFVYDKDRRMIQTNFPSGKSIINDYTDSSNPNDKSRLWQIRTPEGNIDFTYLCGTKIESITKGSESITFEYDGKLVTAEILGGTLDQSLTYNYNTDFDVSAFSYDGNIVNYAYDNDGLLTTAGSFAISRNADNGLPEAITSNSFSLTRTFNGYAEVEGQGVSVGSANVTSWSLTRNKNGRITQKTESTAGIAADYSYTYDSVGRLLAVTKDGNLVEQYSYDPNGTRNYEYNALRGTTGRNYTYSEEDHLLTAGDTEYKYDPDGFLTAKTHHIDPDNPDDPTEITSYAYSSRGELLNVTLPGGTLVEYVHDPLGRRIAKKINGTITEKYLWQGMTRLLAVYDGSNNLLMRFEYADDRMPVAVTTEGVTYFMVYDPVGSLRVVADSAGGVIKRIDYDSFGNIIAETNPGLKIPLGFAGGLHDRDTGLVRFGHRDYDPDVGRWTAKDPIFFAGGDTDLYGYVLNDPVNFVDPLGLFFPLGGPGFTNVRHSEPPSWFEQQQKYPSPVQGIGEGVNMHNAIPGQFAVLGPAAIIGASPYIQRGLVSPIMTILKYRATPIPIMIDPELIREALSPSNAEAAETSTSPCP